MSGLLLLALALGAADVTIDRPVVDVADAVSADAEARLDARLRQMQGQTGVQMAIAVINTTDGEPIADYSNRVANAWGGGRAGVDDGLLFVVALRDHRMRLEVGEGLEGVISDGRAATLIDAAVPKLRADDVDGALSVVVEGVYGRISHLRPGAPRPTPSIFARATARMPELPLVLMAAGAALLTSAVMAFAIRRSTRRTVIANTVGPAAIFLVLSPFAARFLAHAPEWFGLAVVAIGVGYGGFAAHRTRRTGARVDVVGVAFAVALAAAFGYAGHHTNFDAALFLPLVFLSPIAWMLSGVVLMIGSLFLGFAWERGGEFLGDAAGNMVPTSKSSGSSSSSSSPVRHEPDDSWRAASSSSSSSSSSSGGYSGGGGSFGGGGASGSW